MSVKYYISFDIETECWDVWVRPEGRPEAVVEWVAQFLNRGDAVEYQEWKESKIDPTC